ncbi:hypothetical protein SAMN02745148_03555 [Modicisalibacter ilicicola DSM 19980]|uniref:Uncharacterized protein n=1 Tax=Modicisalibacter ilicicola DSM 19980 TaxID=1121942 RepID=A0A1M5EKM5_9GAMM|nr:hypothetical protein [Halomonas ilicicola]SHF79765.1 hypothetical protein SAMN02745148_03555 [Halomonas ilicicola DSM 19980]
MPTIHPTPAALLLFLLCLTPTATWAQSSQQAEWQAYEDALSRGERQAQIWHYGWTGIYATSLAVNAYEASEADDDDDRFDARVGTVKSALALSGMFLDTQPHPAARREFERLQAAGDLEQARDLMREVAAEERARRSWQARVDSLIVNTLGGLAIGLGDDRPGDGAISFATGMLVSELQLRTQPTQAGHALNRFQPARLSLGGMHLDYQYAWTLAPNQVGVHIRY